MAKSCRGDVTGFDTTFSNPTCTVTVTGTTPIDANYIISQTDKACDKICNNTNSFCKLQTHDTVMNHWWRDVVNIGIRDLSGYATDTNQNDASNRQSCAEASIIAEIGANFAVRGGRGSSYGGSGEQGAAAAAQRIQFNDGMTCNYEKSSFQYNLVSNHKLIGAPTIVDANNFKGLGKVEKTPNMTNKKVGLSSGCTNTVPSLKRFSGIRGQKKDFIGPPEDVKKNRGNKQGEIYGVNAGQPNAISSTGIGVYNILNSQQIISKKVKDRLDDTKNKINKWTTDVKWAVTPVGENFTIHDVFIDAALVSNNGPRYVQEQYSKLDKLTANSIEHNFIKADNTRLGAIPDDPSFDIPIKVNQKYNIIKQTDGVEASPDDGQGEVTIYNYPSDLAPIRNFNPEERYILGEISKYTNSLSDTNLHKEGVSKVNIENRKKALDGEYHAFYTKNTPTDEDKNMGLFLSHIIEPTNNKIELHIDNNASTGGLLTIDGKNKSTNPDGGAELTAVPHKNNIKFWMPLIVENSTLTMIHNPYNHVKNDDKNKDPGLINGGNNIPYRPMGTCANRNQITKAQFWDTTAGSFTSTSLSVQKEIDRLNALSDTSKNIGQDRQYRSAEQYEKCGEFLDYEKYIFNDVDINGKIPDAVKNNNEGKQIKGTYNAIPEFFVANEINGIKFRDIYSTLNLDFGFAMNLVKNKITNDKAKYIVLPNSGQGIPNLSRKNHRTGLTQDPIKTTSGQANGYKFTMDKKGNIGILNYCGKSAVFGSPRSVTEPNGEYICAINDIIYNSNEPQSYEMTGNADKMKLNYFDKIRYYPAAKSEMEKQLIGTSDGGAPLSEAQVKGMSYDELEQKINTIIPKQSEAGEVCSFQGVTPALDNFFAVIKNPTIPNNDGKIPVENQIPIAQILYDPKASNKEFDINKNLIPNLEMTYTLYRPLQQDVNGNQLPPLTKLVDPIYGGLSNVTDSNNIYVPLDDEKPASNKVKKTRDSSRVSNTDYYDNPAPLFNIKDENTEIMKKLVYDLCPFSGEFQYSDDVLTDFYNGFLSKYLELNLAEGSYSYDTPSTVEENDLLPDGIIPINYNTINTKLTTQTLLSSADLAVRRKELEKLNDLLGLPVIGENNKLEIITDVNTIKTKINKAHYFIISRINEMNRRFPFDSLEVSVETSPSFKIKSNRIDAKNQPTNPISDTSLDFLTPDNLNAILNPTNDIKMVKNNDVFKTELNSSEATNRRGIKQFQNQGNTFGLSSGTLDSNKLPTEEKITELVAYGLYNDNNKNQIRNIYIWDQKKAGFGPRAKKYVLLYNPMHRKEFIKTYFSGIIVNKQDADPSLKDDEKLTTLNSQTVGKPKTDNYKAGASTGLNQIFQKYCRTLTANYDDYNNVMALRNSTNTVLNRPLSGRNANYLDPIAKITNIGLSYNAYGVQSQNDLISNANGFGNLDGKDPFRRGDYIDGVTKTLTNRFNTETGSTFIDPNCNCFAPGLNTTLISKRYSIIEGQTPEGVALEYGQNYYPYKKKTGTNSDGGDIIETIPINSNGGPIASSNGVRPSPTQYVFEGIGRNYTLQVKIDGNFKEYGDETNSELKKIYQNAGWPVTSSMMTTLDGLDGVEDDKKKDGIQSNNQAGISQSHITRAALYGKNKNSDDSNEGSYIDTTRNKYFMNVKDILPAGINKKESKDVPDSNLSDKDFTEPTNKLLVKYGKIASRPGYFSLSYSLLYKAIEQIPAKGTDPVVFMKDKPVNGTNTKFLDLIKKHTTKVSVKDKVYYDYPEVLYFNTSQYRYNKQDGTDTSLSATKNELFVDTQINGLKNDTDIKFLNLLGLEDDDLLGESVFEDNKKQGQITQSFRNIGCLNGFCQFGNPLNKNFNPQNIFGQGIDKFAPPDAPPDEKKISPEAKSTSKTKCGRIFNTAEGTSFMRTYYTQGNKCIDIDKRELPPMDQGTCNFFISAAGDLNTSNTCISCTSCNKSDSDDDDKSPTGGSGKCNDTPEGICYWTTPDNPKYGEIEGGEPQWCFKIKNSTARDAYYKNVSQSHSPFVSKLKGYSTKAECERAVACYCKDTGNDKNRCKDEYKKPGASKTRLQEALEKSNIAMPAKLEQANGAGLGYLTLNQTEFPVYYTCDRGLGTNAISNIPIVCPHTDSKVVKSETKDKLASTNSKIGDILHECAQPTQPFGALGCVGQGNFNDGIEPIVFQGPGAMTLLKENLINVPGFFPKYNNNALCSPLFYSSDDAKRSAACKGTDITETATLAKTCGVINPVDEKTDENKLSGGAIAGIVTGSVVGLGAVGVGVYFFRARNFKK